jgi:hypothetical protein
MEMQHWLRPLRVELTNDKVPVVKAALLLTIASPNVELAGLLLERVQTQIWATVQHCYRRFQARITRLPHYC